jgi:uncharacterized protein involved in type VI secretion and phage assembly
MTGLKRKSGKAKSTSKQLGQIARGSIPSGAKEIQGNLVSDASLEHPVDAGSSATTPVERSIREASPTHIAPEPARRWYGVYPALVADIDDPDNQGRVKIIFPWAPNATNDPGDKYPGHWARLATLMAGNNRGSWFIPDLNDEVLVAFEGGDPRRPYVIGALWNGQDSPPESMDASRQNDRKVLCSRNGVKITIDDSDGQEFIMLETPGGQYVVLHDGPGGVTIKDSYGNSLELEASGITITASTKVTLNASVVELSTSTLKVDCGMAKFSGVVKCDTLIANSVVSSSYTPGAGNIW